MENGGNREQTGYNNNGNNLGWEQTWALNNHSRFNWGNTSCFYTAASDKAEAATTNTAYLVGNTSHSLFYPQRSQSPYAGDGSNLHPDPHLVCLKLGKRHYFEDATTTPICERRVAGGFSTAKKAKPYNVSYDAGGDGGVIGTSKLCSPLLVTSKTAVPRCQVEGCLVPLINAKDYHRRHKVCEAHSKASKVMVLGLEQRFCQQCSRFHVVPEFDDSKRSCRRRLAGHNERRRKSSHDSLSRNCTRALNNLMAGAATFPSLTGRALSLLSSNNPTADDSFWISSSDLTSRCSAALGELIAENRAAIPPRHLLLDGGHLHDLQLQDPCCREPQSNSDSMANACRYQHQMLTHQHNWGRYDDIGSKGTHVTLDLMQPPSEALRLLSMRGKTNHDEEEEEEEEEEEDRSDLLVPIGNW